jgi:hypothetical protein
MANTLEEDEVINTIVMDHCLKKDFKLVDRKKVVYGNFKHNFSPICSKKHSYVLFTAKGNVRIAEWSAYEQTAHAVVRSCRKFEKHCYI